MFWVQAVWSVLFLCVFLNNSPTIYFSETLPSSKIHFITNYCAIVLFLQ